MTTTSCDCCATAMQFTSLTRNQYSMGCVFCLARYLRDGGKHEKDWERYGVSVREGYTLRAEGVFVDPELKRRSK